MNAKDSIELSEASACGEDTLDSPRLNTVGSEPFYVVGIGASAGGLEAIPFNVV